MDFQSETVMMRRDSKGQNILYEDYMKDVYDKVKENSNKNEPKPLNDRVSVSKSQNILYEDYMKDVYDKVKENSNKNEPKPLNDRVSVSKSQNILYEDYMKDVYDNVKGNSNKNEPKPLNDMTNADDKKAKSLLRRKDSFNPAIPDFVEDSFSMYQVPLHELPPLSPPSQKTLLRRKNSFDPNIPNFVEDQFGIMMDTPTNIGSPTSTHANKSNVKRRSSMDYVQDYTEL